MALLLVMFLLLGLLQCNWSKLTVTVRVESLDIHLFDSVDVRTFFDETRPITLKPSTRRENESVGIDFSTITEGVASSHRPTKESGFSTTNELSFNSVTFPLNDNSHPSSNSPAGEMDVSNSVKTRQWTMSGEIDVQGRSYTNEGINEASRSVTSSQTSSISALNTFSKLKAETTSAATNGMLISNKDKVTFVSSGHPKSEHTTGNSVGVTHQQTHIKTSDMPTALNIKTIVDKSIMDGLKDTSTSASSTRTHSTKKEYEEEERSTVTIYAKTDLGKIKMSSTLRNSITNTRNGRGSNSDGNTNSSPISPQSSLSISNTKYFDNSYTTISKISRKDFITIAELLRSSSGGLSTVFSAIMGKRRHSSNTIENYNREGTSTTFKDEKEGVYSPNFDVTTEAPFIATTNTDKKRISSLPTLENNGIRFVSDKSVSNSVTPNEVKVKRSYTVTESNAINEEENKRFSTEHIDSSTSFTSYNVNIKRSEEQITVNDMEKNINSTYINTISTESRKSTTETIFSKLITKIVNNRLQTTKGLSINEEDKRTKNNYSSITGNKLEATKNAFKAVSENSLPKLTTSLLAVASKVFTEKLRRFTNSQETPTTTQNP